MHPPKTASTFCLTIQHACDEISFIQQVAVADGYRTAYGCAILSPKGTQFGNQYHNPLSKEALQGDHIEEHVTILRDPESRMISSYCDGIHEEGLPKEEVAALKSHLIYSVNNEEGCIKNFLIYSNFHANHGCYTKMLNGFPCSADVNVTKKMTETALDNLRKFRFVGIFEEYAESVDLFLKIISPFMEQSTILANQPDDADGDNDNNENDDGNSGDIPAGLSPPLPIELEQVRMTTHPCLTHLRTAAAKSLFKFKDQYDSVIYKEAKAIYSRLRESYENRDTGI